MLIFSCILTLVECQSRTEDYISKRGDGVMYRTTPINRNKVLQGLQNLKFDDVENLCVAFSLLQ